MALILCMWKTFIEPRCVFLMDDDDVEINDDDDDDDDDDVDDDSYDRCDVYNMRFILEGDENFVYMAILTELTMVVMMMMMMMVMMMINLVDDVILMMIWL